MDKANNFISKIYSLNDKAKNKIITYDEIERKLSLTVLQLPEEKIRFNPIFTNSLTIQNTVQPYPERAGSWYEYYFTNERGKIRPGSTKYFMIYRVNDITLFIHYSYISYTGAFRDRGFIGICDRGEYIC